MIAECQTIVKTNTLHVAPCVLEDATQEYLDNQQNQGCRDKNSSNIKKAQRKLKSNMFYVRTI